MGKPSGHESESMSGASNARQLAKRVSTYDPKNVVMKFGGVPIEGFADGELIEVQMDTFSFFPSFSLLEGLEKELQSFDTDAMLRAPDSFSTDISYTEQEMEEMIEEAAELPTVHDLKLSEERAEQLRRASESWTRPIDQPQVEVEKVGHGSFRIKGPH